MAKTAAISSNESPKRFEIDSFNITYNIQVRDVQDPENVKYIPLSGHANVQLNNEVEANLALSEKAFLGEIIPKIVSHLMAGYDPENTKVKQIREELNAILS